MKLIFILEICADSIDNDVIHSIESIQPFQSLNIGDSFSYINTAENQGLGFAESLGFTRFNQYEHEIYINQKTHFIHSTTDFISHTVRISLVMRTT